VIRRAQHSRRRRWAITSTCTAVIVIATVPVALTRNWSHSSGRHVPPGSASASAPAHPASTVALIFAAALTGDGGRSPSGGSVREIEVLDHTCTNLSKPDSASCVGEPIPVDVQRDVLATLPANPPVRFVGVAAQHPLGSSTPLGDVVFVTFGPVQITGHRAQVFIQSWCGFNCVQGQTFVLTDRDGVWTVTGTTGPAYIS
jgi:hypothetical protein